ncbi:hypothetical protein [Dysgonomonas capnocytophagoides]|uniref:hypothetical protein n=1 Tax=Dysgonomonas capnocytophagoides TaxID=45254 RepID=UPI003342B01E
MKKKPYEDREKIVYIYHDRRKALIGKEGLKINMMKYCIIDVIRRYTKMDSGYFEYTHAWLANWLDVSQGTVSTHVNYLKEVHLLEETKIGLFLSKKAKDIFLKENDHRALYVRVSFTLNKKIMNEYDEFLTIEQFAVLMTIYIFQKRKYRQVEHTYLANSLILNRNTISNSINKLKEIGLLIDKLKVCSFVEELFERIEYKDEKSLSEIELLENRNIRRELESKSISRIFKSEYEIW